MNRRTPKARPELNWIAGVIAQAPGMLPLKTWLAAVLLILWRSPLEPETWEPSSREEALEQSLVHLAFHLPTREDAAALEPALAAVVPEEVEVHAVIAPYSRGGLLEVVPRGGKAWTLRYFAETLGVPEGATAAVGDELNDAVMLDAAGHPYTVGGSILAEQRPAATEVGPAAGGAVADAIEDFLERLG